MKARFQRADLFVFTGSAATGLISVEKVSNNPDDGSKIQEDVPENLPPHPTRLCERSEQNLHRLQPAWLQNKHTSSFLYCFLFIRFTTTLTRMSISSIRLSAIIRVNATRVPSAILLVPSGRYRMPLFCINHKNSVAAILFILLF